MPPAHASREDLQAALAARRDLGPEYEAEVVDGFLDAVERGLEARVAAQVEQRLAARAPAPRDHERDDRGFVLGLVSLGTGIPITAIAGGTADVWGVLAAWAGIAAVNAAAALGRRG